MPTFTVHAVTPEGKRIKILRESPSQQELVDSLLMQNYSVLNVTEELTPAKEPIKISQIFKKLFEKKDYTKELAIATRQLATLLGAGINIIVAIRIIIDSSPAKFPLKEALVEMEQGLQRGEKLEGIMEQFPYVFSPYYRGLVTLGMNTGNLKEALDTLATDMERDLDIRNKIIAAVTYPVFTFSLAVVLNIFLFIAVLPKIIAVIRDLNVDLPLPTILLMGVMDYVCNPAFLLIASIIMIFVFYQLSIYVRTPMGKYNYDTLMLHMPLLGNIKRIVYSERFCRSLGILLYYNVPIQDAITVTGQICNNSYMDHKLIYPLGDAIEEGRYVADTLISLRKLPPVVTQMVVAGEATGDLGGALIQASNIFKNDLSANLQKLLTLIEPFMIIVMSAMVLSVILAIMLPIYQVMQQFGQH